VRQPAPALPQICRGESSAQTAKRVARDSSSCGPPRETSTLQREQDRPCVRRQVQATKARANRVDRTEGPAAPSPQPSQARRCCPSVAFPPVHPAQPAPRALQADLYLGQRLPNCVQPCPRQ